MTGRICPRCDREILPELVEFDSLEDVVDIAGEEFPDVDETDFERVEVAGAVRLSCSCSYYDVELNGSVSAFDFLPGEWVYQEEDRLVTDGGESNGGGD